MEVDIEFYELAKALRAMKVETGSLVCLGCRYENNCGIKGCAILVQAASAIDILPKEVGSLTKGLCGVWQECDRLRADQKKLLEAYDAMSRDLEARTKQVRELQEELERVKYLVLYKAAGGASGQGVPGPTASAQQGR